MGVTAAALLASAVSHPVLADADISFHGTLIEEPPCVINGGETVTVPFGDVLITRVTDVGNQGTLDVDYIPFQVRVECANTSQYLRVRLSGTPIEGEHGIAVFSSGVAGLGIMVGIKGRTTLGPNLWWNLYPWDYADGQLNMEAALVATTTDLPGGGFRALTTLAIDYP